MTISDIKFRRSLTDGTLKAIASLTIDGFIAIHEIKPSRKDESGNYHDIVHPINDRARNLIESAVLSAYKIYAESQVLISNINITND